jgi:hypothetical protein
MEPTSDCQVTPGAGSLAMLGKDKMAAWQDFDKDLGWNLTQTARGRWVRVHRLWWGKGEDGGMARF